MARLFKYLELYVQAITAASDHINFVHA